MLVVEPVVDTVPDVVVLVADTVPVVVVCAELVITEPVALSFSADIDT